MSIDAYFQPIQDFDAQSANGAKCYFSNLPKQEDGPGKQPHEHDDFILRGPDIAFEGYLDIRPEVIRATAITYLGMLPAEQADTLRQEQERTQSALVLATERQSDLEARLSQMILQNAEQLVQLAALQGELDKAYEELYEDEPVSEDA